MTKRNGSLSDVQYALPRGSNLLALVWQVAGFPEELLAEAGKRLQVGEIIGSGRGYFKLARGAEPGNGRPVDAAGTPGARPPTHPRKRPLQDRHHQALQPGAVR